MVSSTFTDLVEHRKRVKEAIEKLGFHAVVMESSGSNAFRNIVETSLGMVRDCAAYIGVLTHRYGQTPEDTAVNPQGLSITELEFDEAMRLGRPILLFVMSDNHPGTKADFETDPGKLSKLEAFKAKAKQMRQGSKIHRVWEEFSSPGDFAQNAAIAIGNLARELPSPDTATPSPIAPAPVQAAKPVAAAAPALRALPDYIGSHSFLGRDSELQTLADWAMPADPHPVLLFEAMGGTGKSILTWHWLNHHAPQIRPWAGRFWYSFYERGATMAEFCREALSYMTGSPVEQFRRMRTPELGDWLVAELKKRPWLLVLDGLERVLVQYNRLDAAQMRDDEADNGKDLIASRDPCSAIHPDDDDLLRRLTTVEPSKLLVSTRLLPSGVTNRSGIALPGVRRELLKGLRPSDAEALFRQAGVHGESAKIQAFLQANCDCHPLVVGALAGLVGDYLPERGNFDRWAGDRDYGRKLNLADLDLKTRKEHILDAAVAALSPEERKLLHVLALLSGGAEFAVLEALNPHLPAKPEKKEEPEDPRRVIGSWHDLTEENRTELVQAYEKAKADFAAYPGLLAAWRADPLVRAAPAKLRDIVRNLERRGLLQYDHSSHRYDLHPVVRGVASGRMNVDERKSSGSVVVDYFSARAPADWDDAEKLEDVADGIQLVMTLCGMGRYDHALTVYMGSLSAALAFNLEADAKDREILRSFFPQGWEEKPVVEDALLQSWLVNNAALRLATLDKQLSQRLLEIVIKTDLAERYAAWLATGLQNFAPGSGLAAEWRVLTLALELARADGDQDQEFASRLLQFKNASIRGDVEQADLAWSENAALQQPPSRATYRPGDAECGYAWHKFRHGDLTEDLIAKAETLATGGRNRRAIRETSKLRGLWRLETGDEVGALGHLTRAVTMAREVGLGDETAEAALALTRLRCGQGTNAHEEAARLDGCSGSASLYLSELWRELGEGERAIQAALRAHAWAVQDGEPYVYRWELNWARRLLAELGQPLPEVPVCDPAMHKPFDWEKDVRILIRELRQEKAAARKDAERAQRPKPRRRPKAKPVKQ